jgi:hypothetical protein
MLSIGRLPPMLQRLLTLAGTLLLLVLAACTGQPQVPPATAEVMPTAEAAATAPAPSQAAAASAPVPTTSPPDKPIFVVAVIVDSQSQEVSREQASAAIMDAANLLGELTGVQLVMDDYVRDPEGGSTGDIASRYLTSRATAPPNGLLLFSRGDGDAAKSRGGYSFGVAPPAPFRNSFVSPSMGSNHAYVAVVDFGHKYAPCGYGGAEAVQSTVALGGECADQPGEACVQANGYSMCASANDDLYASGPGRYTISLIIHELLQPFTQGGAQDDYGSPECNAQMGYPAGFRDLQESQYHSDLCPSVYEAFVQAYQP